MKTAFLIPLLLLPATAHAAPPPKKPAPRVAPQPLPAKVRLSVMTSMGPFVLELDREHAPLTTANFLKYVDAGLFTGAEFYRAMKSGAQDEGAAGLIQGKARWDGKRIFPPVKHEPTTLTGIKHLDATISMARGAIDTATSSFFITLGPMPALDADPAQAGDNQGFAAFGRVVEGMDVIRKIHAAPVSATLGEGYMKGQMLAPVVKIVSARRVAVPVVASKP